MRLLRTKHAKDVVEMIADIFKVGPLTYPKIFQCVNGSEFKAEVNKMLEKHGVNCSARNDKIQTYSHSICRSSEQNPRREIIQGARCARVE